MNEQQQGGATEQPVLTQTAPSNDALLPSGSRIYEDALGNAGGVLLGILICVFGFVWVFRHLGISEAIKSWVTSVNELAQSTKFIYDSVKDLTSTTDTLAASVKDLSKDINESFKLTNQIISSLDSTLENNTNTINNLDKSIGISNVYQVTNASNHDKILEAFRDIEAELKIMGGIMDYQIKSTNLDKLKLDKPKYLSDDFEN